MEHLKLGASIYVPSNRNDLVAVSNRKKLEHARSVIFCTEDSINENELSLGLMNIQEMLNSMEKVENRLNFIRVRNSDVLNSLLGMKNIDLIDGFVLPKITANNFHEYVKVFVKNGNSLSKFKIMPTVETKETFSTLEMDKLLNNFLENDIIKNSILSIRIGGNDLLNILGLRRSKHRNIYQSPLSTTISNLVSTFKPNGFNLTAPVCEFLYDNKILNEEVPIDLEFGLFGKTAIHPDQIHIIEKHYMVAESDVLMANAILDEHAPAVFNMCGTMCEVATHLNWAKEILSRGKIYGIYGK